MKDLVVVWLVWQLMVIGLAGVSMHNKVVNKTYECAATEEVPMWMGVAVPLVAFAPAPQEVIDYCLEIK